MIASSVGMTFKMSKAVPAAKKKTVEETEIVTKERTVLFENWDACTEDTFLASCSEDCCIYDFSADLGTWKCFLSYEGGSPQHFVQTYPGYIHINIEGGAYGGIFLANNSERELELTKKIKIRHKCIGVVGCGGPCFVRFCSGEPPNWFVIWEAELSRPVDAYQTETFEVGVGLLGYDNLCFAFYADDRQYDRIDYILIS